MAMNDVEARDKHGPEASRPVRVCLNDIVFALNLSFALAYALLIGVYKGMGAPRPDDLTYLFLRGAARIGHILLLSPASPVSTSNMERHMPGFREQVGREL